MKSAASEWSRCRPWIERAIPYAHGTHTIEDVERQISEGRLQFWPGENCACVTEIIEYPRLKALNFFLIGGDDLDELLTKMEPSVLQWAKSIGCTRAIGTGRKGWARVLKAIGYDHEMYTCMKEI